jgi:hypothetical protein
MARLPVAREGSVLIRSDAVAAIDCMLSQGLLKAAWLNAYACDHGHGYHGYHVGRVQWRPADAVPQ